MKSWRIGKLLTRSPDKKPAIADMNDVLVANANWNPMMYVINFDDTGNSPRTELDGDGNSNINLTNRAKMSDVLK